MLNTSSCTGWIALSDWDLIRVEGADASQFLHQQLSQDFLLVKPGTARFAAYCSPKGRMLASVVAVPLAAGEGKSIERWGLVMPQALIEATLKRLSMFVLRAKVKLSHEPGAWQIWGGLGEAAQSAFDSMAWANPPTPWQCGSPGHNWPESAVLVALHPAPDCPRAMIVTPRLDEAHQPSPTGATQAWSRAEVASGIAHVDAVGREAFVPQMLNYESVGGVNFKKGCYPGQEVVARSQFRGAIKRRTVRASSVAAMPPGTEVFLAGDEREPVGVVVNSAAPWLDQTDHLALVCLHTEALTASSLRLGNAQGPELTLHGLPYPLLEDI